MARLQARSPETLSIEALTLEEIFVVDAAAGRGCGVTGTAWLTPAVTKEIRALFPAWTACLLTLAAGLVVRDPKTRALGLLVYGFGSVMLGAQALGHEYSHRTLPILLAQPIGRKRLLLIKMSVLTVMLFSIAGLAWIVFGGDRGLLDPLWREPRVLALATVCGLFLAPSLTMVCRGTLPAVVFTLALPAIVLILAEITATIVHGAMGGVEFDRVKLTVFWWGVVALCAGAAVTGWRMFMRLEALEGAGPEVALPTRARQDTPLAGTATLAMRRRHPVWLLVKKELRIQQLAFVVVLIHVALWGSFFVMARLAPDVPRYALAPFPALYCGLIALIIGALASAEERQFGTLEWQVLLPMPMWKQWAIKAGVTLGLALLLGIGLPLILLVADGSVANAFEIRRMLREAPLIVLLLATCSLYVSSICASGVRALVLSLPVIAGTFLVFQIGHWAVETVVVRTFFVRRPGMVRTFFEGYMATAEKRVTDPHLRICRQPAPVRGNQSSFG